MIYLIGGAPRVGKSIIAERFAESISARFISTDDLEVASEDEPVMFHGNPKKNVLTPGERLDAVKKEARPIIPKVRDLIGEAINRNQDLVVEGVHLFPSYVAEFIQEFGEVKAVFVGSMDIKLILEGITKNTSENNWLKDSNPAVLRQVAEFTEAFSDYVSKECKKHDLPYKERSDDFQRDVRDVMEELG